MKRRAHGVIGLVVLLCSLMLASCDISNQVSSRQTLSRTPRPTSQVDVGPINRPVPTTGCGQTSPISPGSSANEMIASHPAVSNGASTRMYRVHVPTTYDTNHPIAVVLAFHGYGGSAVGMEGTGFSKLADQQNFIAVYPQGLPEGNSGKPFWASVGPIDYGIDDVLFVSDVLNDLQGKFCVDSHRIYVTGFSNGGGMSGFLACRLAGRIAAFAPVSGNFYALPGGCHPGRPVPILDFHGTADTVLPYKGISPTVNPTWPLPPIPQWLQDWASRDGCTTGPVTFLQESRVTGEQWTGCQGNVTVIHYRINGGGHAWPPAIDGRPGIDVIWSFFQAHPLP